MTDDLHVYSIPLRTRFRGITVREGMLLRGPAGWGEFSPFLEYDDDEARPWLAAALEAAETGWPAPVRDHIPVNATIPAVGAEAAHRLAADSGCRAAAGCDPESSSPDATAPSIHARTSGQPASPTSGSSDCRMASRSRLPSHSSTISEAMGLR